MSRPVVEILAIGTELLLGETIDTNSAWLGAQLAAAGMPVVRRSSVIDDDVLMTSALHDALARADVVICTGGLGPTHDDFTRDVVAAALDRPLAPDAGWIAVLEERYGSRGLTMPPTNRRQAMVPRGGVLLPNPRGSAPGLWIEHGDRIVVLLPGVPVEVQVLTEGEVLPRLQQRYRVLNPVRSVRLRTTGVGESRLAERLTDLIADIAPLDVAFLPTLAGVDVRITAANLEPAIAAQALASAEARLSERIGVAHYGGAGVVHAAVVGAALCARGWRVAFAESCTGGLAAKLMTDVPGSSAYVQGGVVAYDNDVKVKVLGVEPATIEEHGAVSEPVVRAMARGVRQLCRADCGVAISGVAGPAGGTPDKPVGTVWVAVETPERASARLFQIPGQRDDIRERGAVAALELLRRASLTETEAP